MKGLVVFLGAIVATVLWISLFAPLLARALGVPWEVGFRKSTDHLSRKQYVWIYGVLTFGVGFFLCNLVWDALDWRLLAGPASQLTLRSITSRLLECLVLGWCFGKMGAADRDVSPTGTMAK